MRRTGLGLTAIVAWCSLFASGCHTRDERSEGGRVSQGEASSGAPEESRDVGEVRGAETVEQPPEFSSSAFPPTIPDTEWHRDAWFRDDCLRCHETGVEDAPRVVHDGLPDLLLRSKCRSCHVLNPGSTYEMVESTEKEDALFASNAFPPMIPNSGSHTDTWTRDDCLLCHEGGIKGAPVVVHEGLPRILLRVKCRSCHVQVRAVDSGTTP